MKLLVAALGFVLAPSVAQAFAAMSSIAECSTIVDTSNNNSTFDACATWYMEGPSPAMFENGTTVFMGGYRNEYTVLQGLMEGTDTCAFFTDPEFEKTHSTGIKINVQRDDSDKCDVIVSVHSVTTTCSSCSYCGNSLYSADCTNLKHGRSVTCESTSEGSVYFPFTAAALPTTTSAPIVTISAPIAAAAPVKAPKQVRAPVAKPPKPVRAPVVKTAKPVKPPKSVRAPVAKPVKKPVAAPQKY